MADAGIFNNFTSLSDAIRQKQQFDLEQQVRQAQIAKYQEVDVDKLGEMALMKAAQGVQLTPQEAAAAKVVDAKSALPIFNPVTGVLQQRDSLSARMGVGVGVGGQQDPRLGYMASVPTGTPSNAPPALPNMAPQDPFEAQFQSMLSQAKGNPKLQQSIRDEYAKSKIKFNEDQAKSAGFTDRMTEAVPVIEENQKAGTSYKQKILGGIPLVGNALVSDEYQKLDQAERNFINAQLRRESGAAISPSEFDNARKQYFPQPGDSPAVLLQKAQNRQTATEAMKRASGAAYIQPNDLYQQGKAKFDASKKPRLKYNPATGDFE